MGADNALFALSVDCALMNASLERQSPFVRTACVFSIILVALPLIPLPEFDLKRRRSYTF